MERHTILNEYAKIFEVYNDTMMKDMYMEKQNKSKNIQMQQRQQQKEQQKEQQKQQQQYTYVNSNNTKVKGKTYSLKKEVNDVHEKANEMNTISDEHNIHNLTRGCGNDLRHYKKFMNNRNDNRMTNDTTTHTALNAHRKNSEVEKEKKENNTKNNKECKKNNSQDNHHITYCKTCYLQRVQNEIEQLKHKKKKTTAYPREFNHFLKYENIYEAINVKKEKITLYKQMLEPKNFNENDEACKYEVMKELSEQISLKKDMFRFLNNIITVN